MHNEVVIDSRSLSFPRLHHFRWSQNLNPGTPAAEPRPLVPALWDLISVRSYLESNGGLLNESVHLQTWGRKRGSFSRTTVVLEAGMKEGIRIAYWVDRDHCLYCCLLSPHSILHPLPPMSESPVTVDGDPMLRHTEKYRCTTHRMLG